MALATIAPVLRRHLLLAVSVVVVLSVLAMHELSLGHTAAQPGPASRVPAARRSAGPHPTGVPPRVPTSPSAPASGAHLDRVVRQPNLIGYGCPRAVSALGTPPPPSCLTDH